MKACSQTPDLGKRFRQAPAGQPRRLVLFLEAALRRGLGGVTRWRRQRGAVRELQALSDHYLRDIGLERSRIVPAVEAIIRDGERRA